MPRAKPRYESGHEIVSENRSELQVHDRFVRDLLMNRNNAAILDCWRSLKLLDGWLVAGCLFQTIWNVHSDRAPDAQINDYDLFYFDSTDLSAEAERRVQLRVNDLFSHLHITLEVKKIRRECTSGTRITLAMRIHPCAAPATVSTAF